MPTKNRHNAFDPSWSARFRNLGFADFRRMASDPELSKYEKIGFPEAYRRGHEPVIFREITAKLSNLSKRRQTVLEIGCGCGDLPQMLIKLCSVREHRLVLVDSVEMLNLLPQRKFLTKVPGRFPRNVTAIRRVSDRFDAILCYSVLHHVFAEGNVWRFVDAALDLLAPAGQLLLGDIPNSSKRRRFFSSESGAAFHRKFMRTREPPPIDRHPAASGLIDDAVVMGIVQRARNAGLDAYVLLRTKSCRCPTAARTSSLPTLTTWRNGASS